MNGDAIIKVHGETLERLSSIEERLNGLAAIIEERSYGLKALGLHERGHDMDADNLIASLLREEAKAVAAFFESIKQ